MTMRGVLERYFGIRTAGSTISREAIAGATTFLAMSYIIAVNPAILADAGIPVAAGAFATCLAAGLATIAMGCIARLPLAVAPGMGLNAFFAYTIVQGSGLGWQQGLGVVFISGVLFAILTLLGVRRAILRMMPRELLPAIGPGIGMFLMVIGLKNAGLIRGHEVTLVTRGDFSAPAALLAIGTLLLTATLLARGVRTAIVVGIGAATVAAMPLGISGALPAAWDGTFGAVLALDIRGALSPALAEVIFAMLFVDMFDSLGTVIGVIRKARLEDPGGRVPRLSRVMAVDAGATIGGALLGTSTLTTYVESAAGIEVGGRTGLTSLVTGLLFLLALPLAPLVAIIPAAALAAPLIIVGATTMGLAREIAWDEVETAVPAMLILGGMPLLFSIADGLAIGVVAYSALKILRGRAARVSWVVHLLAVVFVARFALLG